MPIEFACPQCGQRLRVPETSAGKQARCPKCSAVVTIPAASAGGSPAPFQPAPPSPAAPTPATPPPSTPQQPTWPTGFGEVPASQGPAPNEPSSPNPFAFNTGAAPAFGAPPPPSNPFQPTSAVGDFGGPPKPINPYSSPQAYSQMPAGPVPRGEISNQVVDAGVVINYAWEIWKANLALLLGVTVTVIGISYAISFGFSLVQIVLQQNDARDVAIIVNIFGTLVSYAVQTFLGIGQALVALKLCRREPAAYSDLFAGGSRFLPVLAVVILFGIGMFVGALACVVPAIVLALFCWPCYYLVVDERAGIIESFSVAYSVTERNRLTTFVLWLASVGIILVGFLALCIGVVFAAPLVTAIWVTAYLMMSGQLPAHQRYGYQ